MVPNLDLERIGENPKFWLSKTIENLSDQRLLSSLKFLDYFCNCTPSINRVKVNRMGCTFSIVSDELCPNHKYLGGIYPKINKRKWMLNTIIKQMSLLTNQRISRFKNTTDFIYEFKFNQGLNVKVRFCTLQ